MRKLVKTVIWLAVSATVVFLVWLAVMPEKQAVPDTNLVHGKGVDYTNFPGEKKKRIKFKASQQRKGEGQGSYFDGFTAEIEPKHAKGEVINASSDLAIFMDSGNHIELKANVRIESPSLLLTGPYLLLKNQNYLSSEQPMVFRLKEISGKAAKGMIYSMLEEVVKLFGVKGRMMKDGVMHDFSCQELSLNREKHVLLMNGEVSMDGGGKILNCERLSITFDDRMEEIQKVAAVEDVRLVSRERTVDQGTNRYEFKAGRMGASYVSGLMETSELREHVELTILTPKGEILSLSEVFVCQVDPPSGNLRTVEMPVRGEWTYQGPDRFFFTSALKGKFQFDETGELSSSEAKGDVDFKIDEYSGGGDRLVYQPRNGKARVSGPGTWIRKKGQLFYGKGGIDVDTTRNDLSSTNWVMSSVSMKGRPPFASAPVMINARSVHLTDRENRILYSGTVEVTQDKVKLKCQDLLLADEELTADRDVLFSFQGKDGPVLLQADSMRISGRKEPVITLEGHAQVLMGDNQVGAQKIVLLWGARQQALKSLQAEKGVHFVGGTYLVDGDSLAWDMEKEMMRFLGRVTIRKGTSFESRGEEVEINVRTQELRILTRSVR